MFALDTRGYFIFKEPQIKLPEKMKYSTAAIKVRNKMELGLVLWVKSCFTRRCFLTAIRSGMLCRAAGETSQISFPWRLFWSLVEFHMHTRSYRLFFGTRMIFIVLFLLLIAVLLPLASLHSFPTAIPPPIPVIWHPFLEHPLLFSLKTLNLRPQLSSRAQTLLPNLTLFSLFFLYNETFRILILFYKILPNSIRIINIYIEKEIFI